MAKIEYGPLVSRVTGALGGLTFRGNGSSGIVQARGTRARSETVDQQRQRGYLAQCRAAYSALEEADRVSFDFSVSEGYEVRKETGGKFSSGFAAFASWYLCRLYTRASTASPATGWWGRTLQRANLLDMAGAVVVGAPSLRLYNASATWTDVAVWVTHATNINRIPGRPAWRLIYPLDGDPAIAWTATGLPGERAYCLEFGPYVAARVSGWVPGSVWAVRYNMAGGNNSSQKSPVLMLQVTG